MGGGFQILRSTDVGFELLDRVLVRAWIATGKGSSMGLHRGPFFFYFYIGEMLMVCRLFGEDGGSLASVPPLLKRDYECRFVSEERKARYVLDMIKHTDEDEGGFRYLVNSFEPEDAPTVLVAPKNSYAPVSAPDQERVMEASRSAYG